MPSKQPRSQACQAVCSSFSGSPASRPPDSPQLMQRALLKGHLRLATGIHPFHHMPPRFDPDTMRSRHPSQFAPRIFCSKVALCKDSSLQNARAAGGTEISDKPSSGYKSGRSGPRKRNHGCGIRKGRMSNHVPVPSTPQVSLRFPPADISFLRHREPVSCWHRVKYLKLSRMAPCSQHGSWSSIAVAAPQKRFSTAQDLPYQREQGTQNMQVRIPVCSILRCETRHAEGQSRGPTDGGGAVLEMSTPVQLTGGAKKSNTTGTRE